LTKLHFNNAALSQRFTAFRGILTFRIYYGADPYANQYKY